MDILPPHDQMAHLFSFLTPKDLISSAQVCSLWKSLIYDHTLIKYLKKTPLGAKQCNDVILRYKNGQIDSVSDDLLMNMLRCATKKDENVDLDLFVEFVKSLAEKNHSGVKYCLFQLFQSNYPVGINECEAQTFFQSALNDGNSYALVYASCNKIENCETPFNLEQMKIAGKLGNHLAYYNLAFHYNQTRQYSKSLKYLKLSAAEGNSCAQNDIGELYLLESQPYKIKKNVVIAQCFFKAALINPMTKHQLLTTQFNLVRCMLNEEKPDHPKIIKILRELAESGCQFSNGMLGECYMNGDMGVQVDYRVAFHHFLTAVQLGNNKAELFVAHCYFNGMGTPVNYDKALSLLLKAASRNESRAFLYWQILRIWFKWYRS